MNSIITNLTLIADAAEYFDRSTSAAWKIRNAITNALVWQANRVIYMQGQDDNQRLHIEQIKLATMREWMRDCNSSSFVLDLTQRAIAKTLGLDRNTSPHDEAVRVARGKCQRALSASRFQEWYKDALHALEGQRRQREENVSRIEDLLQGDGFELDGQLFDAHGVDLCYEDDFISDKQLYDDDAVAETIDRLAETLGNALESMYNECDRQLSGAITTSKIDRLTGYMRGIECMMSIVGVDKTKMAQRQVRLEALINEKADVLAGGAKAIDDAIAQEMQTLSTPVAPPAKASSLDYNERMKQASDAAAYRKQEDAAAAKRSEAARKAAATRAANKAAKASA